MPPGRDEPAVSAASEPGDSYESIWSALSEAQRAAILQAIGSSDTDPMTAERSPAVHETMHTLRRMLSETLGPRADGDDGPSSASAGGWAWQPEDNGLVGVSFDPALIVGGNAPPAGVLVCQQVRVPADVAISEILLDVVTRGAALTSASAAVYESDGTRSAVTADQTVAWAGDGLHRMALEPPIPAHAEPRCVWVGFVATGGTLPAFAVPWISRTAGPNLGLPDPGPQRCGELAEQTSCPETIAPADMRSGPQYWVGLA